jgi:hypothetical protein
VHAGFWWGNPRERGHLEDPGVYRVVILKWVFNKSDGAGLDSSGTGEGQAVVNSVVNLRIQ